MSFTQPRCFTTSLPRNQNIVSCPSSHSRYGSLPNWEGTGERTMGMRLIRTHRDSCPLSMGAHGRLEKAWIALHIAVICREKNTGINSLSCPCFDAQFAIVSAPLPLHPGQYRAAQINRLQASVKLWPEQREVAAVPIIFVRPLTGAGQPPSPITQT